jgi:hypothetical protein
MQLATLEDMRAARAVYGDDAFRAVLCAAPPGILDPRSWNFWHLFFREPCHRDVRPSLRDPSAGTGAGL